MPSLAEEKAFWAAIDAAPDDELPKLVFADWLADRDDPRATCLRWMVAEHKRPAFDSIDTKTWDWWSRMPAQPIHYEIGPRQYVLPLNIFTRLVPRGPGLWKGSPSFEEAMRRACDGWQDCVRDGVEPRADDQPLPLPFGLPAVGVAASMPTGESDADDRPPLLPS